MQRLLACALVLLPAASALAGGRTFALTTLVSNGTTPLKAGETSLTARAQPNAKVSQAFGTSGVLVPVPSHVNAAGTNRLFTVKHGSFFVSPQNAKFKID